jgi:hypothetical protein
MSTGTAGAVLGPAPELGPTTAAALIGAADDTTRLAAAHAAGAHAFVAELPEGYHTPLGPGGVALTPSQRVRLEVARLIALDPSAVVLDDPTQGLDAPGEAAVLPGLWALLRGREVVVHAASPPVRAAVSGERILAPSVRVPEDRRLCALARLLDPVEMSPLLGSMLGPEELPDVRVQSVRYKPEDNAVVHYAVRTGDGWHGVVAYAHAGKRVGRKRKDPRNRRLARRVRHRTAGAEPLDYLREVDALVQWEPLDVRLPIIGNRPERLAERLRGKGIEVADGLEPQLLRYWPRRRAVLRLGDHVLKAYRDPADFEGAWRSLRATKALTRVRTPAYEGVLKAQRTTVQQWLPGHSPELLPVSSQPAGAVLADLHGDAHSRRPAITADHILAKCSARVDLVGRLLPELRSELDTLLADLDRREPHNLGVVTSHGNYHAGQLLAGPTGLVVLDVDRLCLAAPAYDLASYAAHVAFGRPGDAQAMAATLESLVEAYGTRPPGLDWYLATCLLRRAAVPFRFQDEHWPQAVSGLVGLAREALR